MTFVVTAHPVFSTSPSFILLYRFLPPLVYWLRFLLRRKGGNQMYSELVLADL